MNSRYDYLEENKLRLTEKVNSHSFLKRCREGSISLDELKNFLGQQGIYSSYFTRYLCAMMANLLSNDEVLKLSENLFEELGFHPEYPKPHHIIYSEMLDYFSININQCSVNPATQKLIDTMFYYCRLSNPSFGLGALCLGAEAIVPTVYTSIIEGFRSCGISDDKIDFFHLHVECDDGHAETLNEIILKTSRADEAQLNFIVKAGEEVIDARLKFFTEVEDSVHSEKQYCVKL